MIRVAVKFIRYQCFLNFLERIKTCDIFASVCANLFSLKNVLRNAFWLQIMFY